MYKTLILTRRQILHEIEGVAGEVVDELQYTLQVHNHLSQMAVTVRT